MAIIKQKIPITFFEKMKEAIEVQKPKFFDSSTPDLSWVKNREEKKRKNNESDKVYYNRLLKDLSSLNVLAGVQRKIHQKQIDRIQGAISLLDKSEKLGIEVIDPKNKKYYNEMMDCLYVNKLIFEEVDGILKPKEATQNNEYERLLWTLHRFNRYGRKNFRVEEQLMHELLLTDVTNVDSLFLQLPYPAICIYTPFNDILTIRNETVEFSYITDRIKIGGDTPTRIIEFMFVTKDDMIENFQFNLIEGSLINQVESQIFEKYKSPLGKKEITSLVSFILASLLYLNSTEVSKQEIFPIVFFKKTDSKYPVCSLGYNIEVNHNVRYVSKSDNPDPKPMNVLKWTVRGHFRTYRQNEHWKENKTIWIRPFLKGRERADEKQVMKPTNYIVQ